MMSARERERETGRQGDRETGRGEVEKAGEVDGEWETERGRGGSLGTEAAQEAVRRKPHNISSAQKAAHRKPRAGSRAPETVHWKPPEAACRLSISFVWTILIRARG